MASVVVVVLTHPPPPPWRSTFTFHSLSLNSLPSSFFFHYSISRRSFSIAYRRWDSNAETVRSQRFGFGFKRKPDEGDDDDDVYEEEEEYYTTKGKKRRWWSDEMDDGPGGILEDAVDAFWIFKVFKSYGWMLPIILISWLVATGPKAFLMALALPLGQSALSFAFEKLWGGTQSRPKRRRRMRYKRPAGTATDAVVEQEEERDEGREPGKGKMGYQSWVVVNEGSVENGSQRATSFGGWDDLERVKSTQRQSRRAGGSGRTEMEKGKLSRRERKSDTPLLLRLLVAFLPFFGILDQDAMVRVEILDDSIGSLVEWSSDRAEEPVKTILLA